MMKGKGIKIDRKLSICILILILNVDLATQYAISGAVHGYDYYIIHPSEQNIRLIGSDNISSGRILRVVGDNSSDAVLKIELSFI